jgi:hypothetical protein
VRSANFSLTLPYVISLALYIYISPWTLLFITTTK